MKRPALILGILGTAFLPGIASGREQEPSPAPSDCQSPPKRKRPLKNTVHLRVWEYIPEEQFPQYTRQSAPFEYHERGNRFTLDHERVFKGPSVQLPQPDAFPLGTASAAFETPQMTVSTRFAGGDPRVDPPISRTRSRESLARSRLFGGSGSHEDEDSDRPLLAGPQIDVPLKGDVTEWEVASWMPEGTSLHLYARALFGKMEVFDLEADLERYSIGPRLLVPLLTLGEFSAGASLSAGPSFLKTDIGDAVGFETAGGIRGQLLILDHVSLVGSIDLSAYASENVFSWGPSYNIGITLTF